MAKNVFRSYEIQVTPTKAHISPPQFARRAGVAVEEVEELVTEVAEVYDGPSASDLRLEAEAFKQAWEQEKQAMIAAAESEAARIIKEAEEVAFNEVKTKTSQANEVRFKAETESQAIITESRDKAQSMVAEAEKRVADLERAAHDKGYDSGRLEGYQDGKAEAERLVDRLHTILNKVIERRSEIIEESEAQIVGLVLSISRKIVKVLTENQKNVVVNNVIQALKKLRSKSDIVIRVHIEDLKMASEHVQEITERIERIGNVSIMEDSTVDPGGCIIETDFGEIDARISSQFKEIEDKILEVTPIKSRVRENADGVHF